jgi:hypothetical protein
VSVYEKEFPLVLRFPQSEIQKFLRSCKSLVKRALVLGAPSGAKNMPRFKGVLKYSALLTFVLGVFLAIVYTVFSRQIIRFFINDSGVIENGAPMLIAAFITVRVIFREK